MLTVTSYAPHVEIPYGELVVQLNDDSASTAEMERLHAHLVELAEGIFLEAATVENGASGGHDGDALRRWVAQEFAVKRRLLHLHRPVSGYCPTCLAGDREEGQFPGPAPWPCPTVDEVIAALRGLSGA